jgi:hypothetical protein
MNAHPRPLGRLTPPDRIHEEHYPFEAVAPEARPTHQPVPVGTSWYECMDHPEQGSDGRWRINTATVGQLRGGHCYCLEAEGEPDTEESWTFYDQDGEPACEGFGHCRALGIMLKDEFDAYWLYDDARRIAGTFPAGEGAYNRNACAALKMWGAHQQHEEFEPEDVLQRQPWRPGVPTRGIKSYHWAKTVEEVVDVLGFPASVTEVPILNSWGQHGYPHRTYMPVDFLARLLNEEGEASVLIR